MSPASSDSPAPTLDRSNVESIFPLRPLQQALLFHSRSGSEDPGVIQARFVFEGAFDRDAFETAWREVVARHVALRLSVHTSDRGETRLIAWREVESPLTLLDLRDLAPAAREERVAGFLEADRAEGLDLARPPVMRCAVLVLADDRVEVVWTCHHLFLDGWSTSLAMDEVRRLHNALRGSSAAHVLAPVGRYREYVAWLKSQADGGRAYWRERLHGMTAAPRLSLRSAPGRPSGEAYGEVSQAFDPAFARRLTEAAAELGVTIGTLVQGAWALCLGLLFDRADVVFGTTVAGRSAPVPGLESMVGLFSNVVPVRAAIPDESSIRAWLNDLRDEQFRAQSHEHDDLADIQAWTEIGAGPLFESLLIIENFPWRGDESDGDGLRLRSFTSGITSTYPLTVTCIPGDDGLIWCRFDRTRFERSHAEALLALVRAALEGVAAGGDRPVAAVLADLRAERDRLPGSALVAAHADGPATNAYAAPRSAAEIQMTRIWEDVLGAERIGRDDDFFAIGGRSIAAVRVFALIEERFGRSLPITLLLERPTIAQLCHALDSGDDEAFGRPLVTIQADGTRRPIFFVHSGAEEAFLFRSVAAHLGPEQPVYVFQAMGRNDGGELPATIEEIAERYLAELRSVQREGPYNLVGYCFGGVVAYEMARRIRASGEQLHALAVVDSPGPLFKPRSWSAHAVTLCRRNGVRPVASYAVRRALGAMRSRLRGSFSAGESTDSEQRLRVELELMRRACNRAYLDYRPQPIDIPMTVFQTAENEWLDDYESSAWERLAPAITPIEVEGGHTTMFLEPAVRSFARLVETLVADAH